MVKQKGFLKNVCNFFCSASWSQEEYFKFQLERMGLAKGRILIHGYDVPFMDMVETVGALEDAARKVNIFAIVPKSHGSIPLERIAENAGNIEILRIDEELSHGYIVYGEKSVSFWNSNRKTSYVPEIDKGVIYRKSVTNNSFLNSMEEYIFDKSFAKIKDKLLA